jgi:hypothetical protein
MGTRDYLTGADRAKCACAQGRGTGLPRVLCAYAVGWPPVDRLRSHVGAGYLLALLRRRSLREFATYRLQLRGK